jgi:hypothetical protein
VVAVDLFITPNINIIIYILPFDLEDIMSTTQAVDAAYLQMRKNPTKTNVAGLAFVPGIRVAFLDASGALVNVSAPAEISLVSGTGSAGASIIGTTRTLSVNGVATFSNVSVDRAGIGYSFVISSASVRSTLTSKFSIFFGSIDRISFVTQPAGSAVNLTMLQLPTMALVDRCNNVVTTTEILTVSIISNNSTPVMFANSGGRYAVKLTADASGYYSPTASSILGHFSFTTVMSNLQFVAFRPSHNQTVYSRPFNVVSLVGSPYRLGFIRSVGSAYANKPFQDEPQIAVYDASHNRLGNVSGSVTLSLFSGPPNAALNGYTTAPIVLGLADFSNSGLYVDRAGAGFILQASSGNFPIATSAVFSSNAIVLH